MASTRSPSRSSLPKRLGLLLAVGLSALLLAEVVVRLGLRDAWETERLTADTLSTVTRFADDAVLYLELLPNSRVPSGRWRP